MDLESIRRREEVTKHDVKARLEEFADKAGHQHAHKDDEQDLTENAEQLQIHRSLGIVLEKGIAALLALADKADQYKNLQLTARSHNVPAQLTTLGKRMANWGEELERALDSSLSRLGATYPYRGLKGAVGTRLDQITLLGDASKAEQLDQKVMAHLGAPANWESVGQVYPRSLDFEVVSVLGSAFRCSRQFCQDPSDHGRARAAWRGVCQGTNRFVRNASQDEQQKRERINGQAILNGHLAMVRPSRAINGTKGTLSARWSDGSLYLMRFSPWDGLLDTFLTVLSQMEVFPDADQGRVPPVSPLFVVDQFLMMEAVKAGSGEDAHAAIKEHALATVKDLRAGKIKENDLPARLAKDKRIGLNAQAIGGLIKKGEKKVGAAETQVDQFVERARTWGERCPASKEYTPPTIL